MQTQHSPPEAPCPPASDPAALLTWIEGRHLTMGRQRWHLAAFWSRIAELRRLRAELAAEIAADPGWAGRVDALAAAFSLDLAGLDREAQIAAVVAACLPMRFHISAELAHLRQHRRAREVLASAY